MAHFSDSNLTLVLEQVKQEIHVDSEGKGKASIRAVARLVDVSDSSIWRAFQGAAQTPSKLAETLIEQGFEGAAQVAWKTNGIPDIAIASIAHYYAYEAGRYCTSQAKLVCKAFTAIGIRAWMQQVAGWSTPNSHAPKTPSLSPSPQDIAQLYDLILGNTNLDPKLIAGVKLNAIATLHPQLASAAEMIKPVLQIPVDDQLISPTQIAEALTRRTQKTWTAREVNKLLIKEGFQQPHPEGSSSPAYLPTQKGERFSKIILNTAKNTNKTIQTLRWLPAILKELGV
jgi:hypothetical protein